MSFTVSTDVLDLKRIFVSGQVFNWYHLPPYGYKIKRGYEYILIQKDNEIFTSSTDPQSDEYLRYHLRLDSPITHDMLPQTPLLKEVYRMCGGVQILRQDPIRATLAFILSQRNSIDKIMKTMHALEECYFREADISPRQLMEIEWQYFRCGYREEYLRDFCIWLNYSDNYQYFMKLGQYPTADVIYDLVQLHGIGPKIANCIALFAFDKLDAFPIDSWIDKALEAKPELLSVIDSEYAGVVQQYIYMGARFGLFGNL